MILTRMGFGTCLGEVRARKIFPIEKKLYARPNSNKYFHLRRASFYLFRSIGEKCVSRPRNVPIFRPDEKVFSHRKKLICFMGNLVSDSVKFSPAERKFSMDRKFFHYSSTVRKLRCATVHKLRLLTDAAVARLVKHILLRRTSLATQSRVLRAIGFTRFGAAWSYTQLGLSQTNYE